MEDRWIALGIGAIVLGLFLWNRLRLEIVGLLALVAVVLSGLVPLEVAVSGFANEALLTVAAMFVLSAALVRTGGADVLARLLGKLARGSELRLLAASLLLVRPLSAFVNNTPIVAVMLAASNSFLTPIGYQTNTFVFGPGNYRFVDFVRVGGLLNLLLVLAAALVIPRFFPF